MLALINELTDMPDWDLKLFDPDFTFEWKSQKLLTGKDVTRSMLNWCVAEATYHVNDFNPPRIIPALDGGVIKSDDCVDEILKDSLQRAAISLRRVVTKAGRHSSSSVDDIVDPFLFPFSFEKTKTLRGGFVTLKNCISASGQGEPVKRPSDDECVEKERAKYPNNNAWSNRFQWLPFDVVFDRRGTGSPRFACPHLVHHSR